MVSCSLVKRLRVRRMEDVAPELAASSEESTLAVEDVRDSDRMDMDRRGVGVNIEFACGGDYLFSSC